MLVLVNFRGRGAIFCSGTEPLSIVERIKTRISRQAFSSKAKGLFNEQCSLLRQLTIARGGGDLKHQRFGVK